MSALTPEGIVVVEGEQWSAVSLNGDVPVGAILVTDGRAFEAHNEKEARRDPTAHAEVVAIREACKALATFQLTGCDLYTSCEPCPMCLGAIYWARPARVFYAGTAADAAAAGFDDAFIYEEIKLSQTARRIPMAQLLHQEGIGIFKAWNAKTDKTPY